MFQLAFLGLGPVGVVAFVGVTLLMGAAACEMADDNDDKSAFEQMVDWISPDDSSSNETKVVTPSVTPDEADEYYNGGDVPTVPGNKDKEEVPTVFDPTTYKPGELAPDYTPVNPWGYVCVTPELLGPNEKYDEEDDSSQVVSSSFTLSAQAYESGAKYILIFAALFLGVFWALMMYGQCRRPE